MAAIGQALLLLGAVTAGAGTIVSLVGGHRRGPRVAVGLLAVAAVGLVASTLTLMIALVQHDFTLVYVADTSRRAMSAPYRAAATWGGMEGSLLFWTALLASVSAVAVARLSRREPDASPLTIAVPAALTSAFAAITVVTANPFHTLQVPATDGSGLVPILEHPAMVYHPPLLYLGLVSLAPPFALTLGALASGRLGDSWRERCRRWMFVPWILLAVGMVAGANWAYVELGWGGYWAWDPIENTALLPWLAVTAFLHQTVRRREGAAPRADLVGAGLVLLAFVVAILGTLLTRSGAASSVHAFGQATAVGRALLGLTVTLAVVCVAALGRAIARDRRRAIEASLADDPPTADDPDPTVTTKAAGMTIIDRWLTRDGMLRAQLVLVSAALLLILAGTLSPVIRSLFGGDVTMIDGSYFATMTAPVVWLALVLMAIAPARRPAVSIEQIVLVPALVGLVVAATLALLGWTSVVTLVTGALAGFAGSAAVVEGSRRSRAAAPSPRRWAALGPHVAHFGFAVLLLGFAGSTAAQSTTALLGPGQSTTVDGVVLRNDGVRVDDPDGDEPKVVVRVHVERGSASRELEPAITGYRLLGERLAETALWSQPAGDVQVALRDAQDNGTALLEIHTRPLAPFVWWGGLLLVAGGLLAATGTRSSPAPTPSHRTDRTDRTGAGISSPAP